MRVTLTFDNGPDPEGTPVALRALKDRDVPAVFFVVGKKVRAHPDLVAETASAGHVIGNHTWSHSTPFGEASPSGFARSEILRTQEAIASIVPALALFRPVGAQPGAIIDDRLFNEEALETLTGGGYTVALWNVVPRDWELPKTWLDGVVDQCRLVEHAVVLLHDGHPAGMSLLPQFLDALIAAGTDFGMDFPLSCTPILDGVPGPGAAALVTTARMSQRSVVAADMKEQQWPN